MPGSDREFDAKLTSLTSSATAAKPIFGPVCISASASIWRAWRRVILEEFDRLEFPIRG